MRRVRQHRSSGLGRSLTLLRAFLLASAIVLALGAVALSSTLTRDLRSAALDDTALDVAAYGDAVLAPDALAFRRDRHAPAGAAEIRPLRAAAERRARRERLHARRPAGVLDDAANRVGRRRSSPDLRETLESGTPSAALVDAMGDGPTIVKVWTPLHSPSGRVVGATEVALDDSTVEEIVADTRSTVWYAVGLVFGVIWLVLALLVRGASSRMHAQHEDLASSSHDLAESSRALEASLLETIETLNAAVEARDPYTAGHSQRVRRVSLAIGRELRLPARRLGALGTAALFHDIGKIGMPDSILTKPDRLDRAEAAVMREHATRGAEIVARISSLADPCLRSVTTTSAGTDSATRIG